MAAADKIVFSRALEAVSTTRTRLERSLDPTMVRELKSSTGHQMLIGGPGLATEAFRAGLVDQYHVFFVPVIVGGGKKGLPDDVRLELELEDERRFRNGTVFLRYRTKARGLRAN